MRFRQGAGRIDDVVLDVGHHGCQVTKDGRSAIALQRIAEVGTSRVLYRNSGICAIEDGVRNRRETAANAHDFIMSLPEGYETMIGERGGTLSGGQRQRICVARAIIKQPSILILDEPTSAVDPAAAALIRDTVARLQAGKTTLVIAHQFFAMEQFDQIFVFENGRLVEQGTHRQLVARKGHYYALLNHQMGEKREEDAYASNPLRPQPETEGEAETYA